MLYSQLTYLAWGMTNTDLPPTESQLAVFAELEGQLDEARELWRRIRDEEIPALNERAAAEGVMAVILASQESTSD